MRHRRVDGDHQIEIRRSPPPCRRNRADPGRDSPRPSPPAIAVHRLLVHTLLQREELHALHVEQRQQLRQRHRPPPIIRHDRGLPAHDQADLQIPRAREPVAPSIATAGSAARYGTACGKESTSLSRRRQGRSSIESSSRMRAAARPAARRRRLLGCLRRFHSSPRHDCSITCRAERLDERRVTNELQCVAQALFRPNQDRFSSQVLPAPDRNAGAVLLTTAAARPSSETRSATSLPPSPLSKQDVGIEVVRIELRRQSEDVASSSSRISRIRPRSARIVRRGRRGSAFRRFLRPAKPARRDGVQRVLMRPCDDSATPRFAHAFGLRSSISMQRRKSLPRQPPVARRDQADAAVVETVEMAGIEQEGPLEMRDRVVMAPASLQYPAVLELKAP